MQFLADILNVPVDRPRVTETTALGAAYLAGLQTGVFENLEQITGMWECERQFRPDMKPALRESLYAGWLDAVDRKSTRLNSSHVRISYAVFCLKKKKESQNANETR